MPMINTAARQMGEEWTQWTEPYPDNEAAIFGVSERDVEGADEVWRRGEEGPPKR